MTDELANHVTYCLEAHDKETENVDQEKLQKNFDAAMKLSKKASLHEMYGDELKYLENLQCRATFFNILAYGYKN